MALQEHFITGALQLQPSGHSLPDVYLPYIAGESISAKTIKEQTLPNKAERGTSYAFETVFLFIYPDNNDNYIFLQLHDINHCCLALILILFCVKLPSLSFLSL